MIDILVCDSNGEPNETAIQLLFKCLLPKLVAASVDCRNSNVSIAIKVKILDWNLW